MSRQSDLSTFLNWVDAENNKHPAVPFKSSRLSNAARNVEYHFTVQPDSKLATAESVETIAPLRIQDYVDKYVRAGGTVLDCRGSTEDTNALLQPPPSKRRKGFKNMAPNLKHSLVSPTLGASKLTMVPAEETKSKDSSSSTAAASAVTNNNPPGQNRRGSGDRPRLSRRITIKSHVDYFCAAISKWRRVDLDSIEATKPHADNLFLNLPKLPFIPPIETMTEEQREFVEFMEEALKKPQFKVVALTGPAGSVKTRCLDALRAHNVLYVACKGQLVQDINKNSHVHSAMTWAKLGITLLGLSYYGWLSANNIMKRISPEHCVDRLFTSPLFTGLKAPEQVGLLRSFTVLYIDEFSMLNYGEVVMILELIKLYNLQMIVVLVGDPAQLPPIMSVNGDDNSKFILELASREFVLKRAMRFKDEKHAHLMDTLRNRVLEHVPAKEVMQFIDTHFGDKRVTIPRFSIPLYYPQRPCPALILKTLEGRNVTLIKNANFKTLTFPPVIDLIISKTLQEPSMSDFCIENATQCIDWIAEFSPRINSFVCYHLTNLNVHIGALSYSLALYELTGAPVVFVKLYTLLQFENERRPFFGEMKSDRVQWLPLIVGQEYFFMESTAILKRGARVTLVHVEQTSDQRCKFLIVVDEYNVFFQINTCEFDYPVFSSHPKNYMSNYPDEMVAALRNNTMRTVYGFPLMMACFSNIYQSQGATIANKKMYVNFSGCSGAEMYVGMSRCCEADQIVSYISS